MTRLRAPSVKVAPSAPSNANRQLDPRVWQPSQHTSLDPLVAARQDGHTHCAEQQGKAVPQVFDPGEHPVAIDVQGRAESAQR